MNKALLAFAVAALAGPASAAIFSDNFDGTAPALNWDGGTNWDVTGGSIDLVDTGTFSITCAGGGGRCVDLIGTLDGGATSGQLTSIDFVLNPGRYTLAFDYSGNQRGQTDSSFNAAISGGLLSQDLGPLDGSDGNTAFASFSQDFTVSTAGSYNIVFTQSAGSPNIGNLIDNVSLTVVPEPASWAMMITGFGIVGGAMRRRHAGGRIALA